MYNSKNYLTIKNIELELNNNNNKYNINNKNILYINENGKFKRKEEMKFQINYLIYLKKKWNNNLKLFLFFNLLYIIVLFNQIYKYKKNINNLKICLCVIGKKENLYIKEFTNYYKKLGYNHIFLYDNNDINDERFEDAIKKEVIQGFVSIINYRGFRGKDQNPQFDAYKDCYERQNKNYNWLSFFDIDEYLELYPLNIKVQNFLSQKKFKICQVIKINWLYYINNNSLYYENKPLQQRVNIPLFNNKVNEHIKSTVRGQLLQNYWNKVQNPHTSLNNFTTCSSSGKIINSSSPYNIPAELNFAYLKHYQVKSFEEYCLKIKRGRPIPGFNIYRKKKIYSLIISSINDTKKLDIINKVFNISVNNFNRSNYINI